MITNDENPTVTGLTGLSAPQIRKQPNNTKATSAANNPDRNPGLPVNGGAGSFGSGRILLLTA
ncbi:MAG: hypothetical protein CMO80_09845 [Verrucomicrobiales bacterium]|nr:hypothetical protein [Verrucomicrobiales bacterium]